MIKIGRLCGQQGLETFEEATFRLRRGQLPLREHLLQQRQGPPADRHRGAQQMPAAIALQATPIYRDYRRGRAHQPAHHAGIQTLALGMQAGVAQQPIQPLQRRTDTFGAQPAAG
nr:hypothetical protein [Xanthomonas translucens]